MSTLIHSFLLIGPWSPSFQEIGSEIFSDLTRTSKLWTPKSIYFLGLSVTALKEKKFPAFFQELKQLNSHLQLIIVIPKDYSITDLIQLHRQFRFSSLLHSFHGPETEKELYLALESRSHSI